MQHGVDFLHWACERLNSDSFWTALVIESEVKALSYEPMSHLQSWILHFQALQAVPSFFLGTPFKSAVLIWSSFLFFFFLKKKDLQF